MNSEHVVEMNEVCSELETYMISLSRDEWKRDRFDKSSQVNGLSFPYKVWPGVLVRESPEIVQWAIEEGYMSSTMSNPNWKGNIGSALAHISVWDFIAKQPDNKVFLVLEDNALVTDLSYKIVQEFIKLKFDFLNISVHRPTGKSTNRSDLLKMEYINHRNRGALCRRGNKLFHRPNVLLSSYLLRPYGARLLLEYMKKYKFDLSSSQCIIDQCVSVSIHSDKKNSIVAYVVNHKTGNWKYFGHIETKNDSRILENAFT
jgi:GR25 family glycosyltransferase involved in LPS biosynthesis